ncbi:MAG: methyltransferase domain-containing protein [Rhodospirillales bacterium]|jgi:demethylspheroidene O-methyltransferase|nr:methyltransferase domain-containing protein [Rhodospirillales bacterium]
MLHPSGDEGALSGALPMDAPQSWWDRCLAVRDRLLASQRFQRWAAAFPVTRSVAQRRTRALFDLCAGFVYSQVLLACVRLRVFSILSDGPLPVAEIARRLSLSTDATGRLLAAAASLRLLERRRGGRFGLGPLGAAVVGNPAITAMVEHHALVYGDLRDPVALLRAGRPATELAEFWAYAGAEEPERLAADRVAAYSALMAASLPLIAEDILDAHPLRRYRCLLDVGGGEGVFAATAAVHAPRLRVIVFDLPAVAKRARLRLAAEGLSERVSTVGGDFFSEPLPEGADVVTLVRIVHDHDDDAALTLLRNARRALPRGGRLLIAEPMAGTAGAEPVGDAYFGFYLLAMGRGRPRTASALAALLRASGFARSRLIPTRRPLLTCLMVAEAAGA